MKQCASQRMRGTSLIEALLGVFIFVVAFVGLFGLIKMSLKNVGQNKARLGAMLLAEEQLEYMRSLPFDSVGAVSGNPVGIIPATENITLNGIVYARRNVIVWVDDYADGTATTTPIDIVSTDYKQAKVEVQWQFQGTTRSFAVVTNITPKGLETPMPGGIFKITVADAAAGAVAGANIRIYRPSSGLDVNRLTPANGIWYEYGLTPGTGYEITVTKNGYNTSRTYSTTEVANPDPGHLTSIDDNVNAKAFFIDKISNNTIYMYSPPTPGSWTDTFADSSKLASLISMETLAGDLVLTNTVGVYEVMGSATSTWISPANVSVWKQLSWNDTVPLDTTLRYRIYYDNDGTDTLVPDGVLPGNTAGFTSSPVDLSGLNNGSFGITNYQRIKVGVSVTTNDTAVTPSVQSWTVTHDTHSPWADFTFHIRGTKNIGTDASGATIYKYDQNETTNSSGVITLPSLEWDTYTISKSGYDIALSCQPQPQYIVPNTNPATFVDMTSSISAAILIHAKTTLGADIPGALIRLHRTTPVFDETKKADMRCGQSFWNGLATGKVADGNPYTIDVSAPPYTATTTIQNVDISNYSYVVVTTQ